MEMESPVARSTIFKRCGVKGGGGTAAAGGRQEHVLFSIASQLESYVASDPSSTGPHRTYPHSAHISVSRCCTLPSMTQSTLLSLSRCSVEHHSSHCFVL